MFTGALNVTAKIEDAVRTRRYESSIASASLAGVTTTLLPLYPLLYEDIVRGALAEDLGRAGDLTSDSIVPADFEAAAISAAMLMEERAVTLYGQRAEEATDANEKAIPVASGMGKGPPVVFGQGRSRAQGIHLERQWILAFLIFNCLSGKHFWMHTN